MAYQALVPALFTDQNMENQGPEFRQSSSAFDTEGSEIAMGKTLPPPAFSLTAGAATNQNAVAQRKGDGKDGVLTSPRFQGIPDLEKVAGGKGNLREGASGHGVQTIQQCIYDLGIYIGEYGASGEWGAETTYGVEQFQKSNGLPASGILDQATMKAFDGRFGTVDLSKVDKKAHWTPDGVKAILHPWSPVTIETLRDHVTLYSYDRIYFKDEMWNGSSWEVKEFEAGGYNDDTGIGIINETNESVASTLYHEVLHENQPTSQDGTRETENYAYKIEEEFKIGMGLKGDPNLRSKNKQGREIADEKKIDKMVMEEYPSIPADGSKTRLVGKGSKLGDVVVADESNNESERPAQIGETIEGEMISEAEKKWDNSVWQ